VSKRLAGKVAIVTGQAIAVDGGLVRSGGWTCIASCCRIPGFRGLDKMCALFPGIAWRIKRARTGWAVPRTSIRHI